MKMILRLVFYGILTCLGSLVLYSSAAQYLHDRTLYLHKGDTLGPISGLDLSKHDFSLLLLLKNGCEFCEESMPFYRQLGALAEHNQTNVFIAAVVPDGPTTARVMLKLHNVDVPIFPSISLRQLRIRGTPTLLLINREGVVQRIWIGKLPPNVEGEVISTIKDKPYA